jgi:HD superfamily phosphohydrolase YqeK
VDNTVHQPKQLFYVTYANHLAGHTITLYNHIMKTFEKVYADKTVIDLYDRIKQKEKTSAFAYAAHDLTHVNRVIKNCEDVAKLLKIDGKKINEIKVAALLHDIGCAFGDKHGHAERSYIWAKEYLNNTNDKDTDDDKATDDNKNTKDKDTDDYAKDEILKAIREHSGLGSGVYGKILAFADKIDVCLDRLLPAGLLIDNCKEYAHLLSYIVEIEDGKLVVKYTSDGNLNYESMKDYYFTKKLFDTIADLANYFNLGFAVIIDGKPCEY